MTSFEAQAATSARTQRAESSTRSCSVQRHRQQRNLRRLLPSGSGRTASRCSINWRRDLLHGSRAPGRLCRCWSRRLGSSWQTEFGTSQISFSLPHRLNATRSKGRTLFEAVLRTSRLRRLFIHSFNGCLPGRTAACGGFKRCYRDANGEDRK